MPTPFSGHFKGDQYQRLALKANEGPALAIDRGLRLLDVNPRVVGALPVNSAPIDQFSNDLVNLGRIERLPDGSVPLVTYLKNLAFQLKLRGLADQAEPFESVANAVSNRESGLPPQPAPPAGGGINEVVIGFDDTLDFSFLERGRTAGASVARILVPRYENGVSIALATGDPWVMAGTAWLVGEDLVLTNHHVINARKQDEAAASQTDLKLQAGNATVQFDYDASSRPPVEIGVERIVAFSSMADLDYALLKLSAKPSGRAKLQLYPGKMNLGGAERRAMNIIQHPRGETKRVALRNNIAVSADQNTIRYFTDTDYGSSGAPVCDDHWRVVALHRGALPAKDVQFMGKSTAYVNYGTHIESVLEHIATSSAAVAASIRSG